jgi:hypothetical protein
MGFRGRPLLPVPDFKVILLDMYCRLWGLVAT